jgi:protein-S-isoprenylcysteine O-methyltransferase Ste14
VIAGRRFWILVWYGILLLGLLGLFASVHWGRRTHWKNVDEILRAVGTILVSVGMLVLLYPFRWVHAELLGEGLLGVALVAFVAAFILGRRVEREREQRKSGEVPPPPA